MFSSIIESIRLEAASKEQQTRGIRATLNRLGKSAAMPSYQDYGDAEWSARQAKKYARPVDKKADVITWTAERHLARQSIRDAKKESVDGLSFAVSAVRDLLGERMTKEQQYAGLHASASRGMRGEYPSPAPTVAPKRKDFAGQSRVVAMRITSKVGLDNDRLKDKKKYGDEHLKAQTKNWAYVRDPKNRSKLAHAELARRDAKSKSANERLTDIVYDIRDFFGEARTKEQQHAGLKASVDKELKSPIVSKFFPQPAYRTPKSDRALMKKAFVSGMDKLKWKEDMTKYGHRGADLLKDRKKKDNS